MERLFILCVKHPSEDTGWIAVSCCFRSRFTLRELLRNWIRNIFLQRKFSGAGPSYEPRTVHSDSGAGHVFSHRLTPSVTLSRAETTSHTPLALWILSWLSPTWEIWREMPECTERGARNYGPNAQEETRISPLLLILPSPQVAAVILLPPPEPNLSLENQLSLNMHRREKIDSFYSCLFHLLSDDTTVAVSGF